MRPGDVILTSHIRQYLWPEKGWMGYKAGKDEAFVFIFLGVEPRDGSAPFDPIKALEDFGWKRTEITPTPLDLDDQEGRRLRERRTHRGEK